MAIYKGNSMPPFTGTKYGICIYKRCGQYCVRTQSSLTGERVKKDPRFRRTMQYAGWLGQASGIASAIYREAPAALKQFAFFRALTGEAMQLLKAGKSVPETQNILWNKYVNKQPAIKPTQQAISNPGSKSIIKVIAAQQARESFNLRMYLINRKSTGRKVRRASCIHSPPLNKPE